MASRQLVDKQQFILDIRRTFKRASKIEAELQWLAMTGMFNRFYFILYNSSNTSRMSSCDFKLYCTRRVPEVGLLTIFSILVDAWC